MIAVGLVILTYRRLGGTGRRGGGGRGWGQGGCHLPGIQIEEMRTALKGLELSDMIGK